MLSPATEPITPTEARRQRDLLHAAGKKLVFTSGCFDILHAGHVRYLRQAKALGHALCVAMNSDASVRALKGPNRPVNNELDRAEVLLALESVDMVVVFDSLRTTALIDEIQPHIFAKGGDYTVDSLNPEERGAMDRVGAEIHILPEVKGKSTSATILRMQTEEGQTAPKRKIAVLGSGIGRNYQALHEAIVAHELEAEVVLVISDVADSGILQKAAHNGAPHLHIAPGESKSRLSPAAEKEIIDRIRASGANLVVLAGFMRIVSAEVIQSFAGRLINIHPSLLPKHRGRNAIAQALADGSTMTGCTIHHVDSGIDTGEIIAQTAITISPGETESALAERIHAAEHALLPRVIANLPLPPANS